MQLLFPALNNGRSSRIADVLWLFRLRRPRSWRIIVQNLLHFDTRTHCIVRCTWSVASFEMLHPQFPYLVEFNFDVFIVLLLDRELCGG